VTKEVEKRQSDEIRLDDGITLARGTRKIKQLSVASKESLISSGGSFVAHM
jgi:hypothetical protein